MSDINHETFVVESRSIAESQIGKPRGLREQHYCLPLPAGKRLKVGVSFMGDYELMCLVAGTDGRDEYRRNSFEGNGDIVFEPTLEDRVITVTARRKICNHRTELGHCSTLQWEPCVSARLITEAATTAEVGWDDQRAVYEYANVKAVISVL